MYKQNYNKNHKKNLKLPNEQNSVTIKNIQIKKQNEINTELIQEEAKISNQLLFLIRKCLKIILSKIDWLEITSE